LGLRVQVHIAAPRIGRLPTALPSAEPRLARQLQRPCRGLCDKGRNRFAGHYRIGHTLYVRAAKVTGRNRTNQRDCVPSDASFIEREGCRGLGALEPRRYQPGPRRAEVFLAKLGNGNGVPRLLFFALRIAPVSRRSYDLFSPFARLFNRQCSIGADLDTTLRPPSPDLRNENLSAACINPTAKATELAAP
jgi:hypothetical protein